MVGWKCLPFVLSQFEISSLIRRNQKGYLESENQLARSCRLSLKDNLISLEINCSLWVSLLSPKTHPSVFWFLNRLSFSFSISSQLDGSKSVLFLSDSTLKPLGPLSILVLMCCCSGKFSHFFLSDFHLRKMAICSFFFFQICLFCLRLRT